MPLYKGATEITSGKLYKGATNIENGYKETDSFYVNETTVSFATPTGQGFSYTTPSPQSSTGVPGSAFPSTTFVISASGQALGGTAVVSGLPPTLSVTNQSYSGSGPGNSLTITIGGTFPTTSYLNTALTISGLSVITYYTVSLNYSGLTSPSDGRGYSVSRSGSISGSGAINVTNNGSTWSGQFPAGTSISIRASYSPVQTGSGITNLDYREVVFNGSGSGGSFSVSSPFSMSGGLPSNGASGFSVTSNSITLNGNASYSVSGGYTSLTTKSWGFSIATPPTSAPSLTAVVVGNLYPNNGYPLSSSNSFVISASGGGALIASGNPNSGGFFSGFSTTANSTPTGIQIQKTSPGSADFEVQWGSYGKRVYWTTTFT